MKVLVMFADEFKYQPAQKKPEQSKEITSVTMIHKFRIKTSANHTGVCTGHPFLSVHCGSRFQQSRLRGKHK
ncbi:MAG: hypothetical protein FD181_2267 [Prolixibacteraceae bacterium]|nr:MAG: hypothetical protein FD181_2267 [Prolixibacteraceae bacterium]